MFVTSYGNFNGTTWENMMQVVFKKKYMSVLYQRIMASPGDFGLEGFTRDGQTFQCYCPEVNVDSKTLYEKQRDKITADINKLKTNSDDLNEILGGVQIKKWVLVTPRMGHRDLINHCHTKRDLVKSWNLPFINSTEFEVLIHEGEDYLSEIGEYFSVTGQRLSIKPNSDDTNPEKIVQWKNAEITLIKNAFSKNEVRINSIPAYNGNSDKANELTDQTARNYLNGESVLSVWRSTQPDNHQRFIELLASLEDELREKCLLNFVDPNQFVKEIAEYTDTKIKAAFTHLDESTIIRLKNYSIAFWLLRCPLYFETSNNAEPEP